MKTIQLCVNPFQMNCWIYFDEISGEGVIIDPGAYTETEQKLIKDTVEKNNIKIKYIINTHGHIDHILGNKFAKDEFNVPLYMHNDDMFLIDNCAVQSEMFGLEFPEPPKPDELITEELKLKIGDTELEFIHTPGHSPGSVSIIDHKNKSVFCGDLVFKNSIGRTDLPQGDINVLMQSVEDLFKVCKDNYNLYPGHMEQTNVGDEKKYNPFLKPGAV